MKSIIKIMLWIVEFILGAILVVYAIFSTMLIKISITDGTIRDGFGRILQPAPAWLLTNDNYAGVGWLVFDTVFSFVVIAIMYFIYLGIKKLGHANEPKNNSQHVSALIPQNQVPPPNEENSAPAPQPTNQQNLLYSDMPEPQSEIEELMQELELMRWEEQIQSAELNLYPQTETKNEKMGENYEN